MAVDLMRLFTDEAALHNAAITGKLVRCDQIRNVLDGLNWFRCKAAMAEERLAKVETDLAVARSWTDSAVRTSDMLRDEVRHLRDELTTARRPVSRIMGTPL